MTRFRQTITGAAVATALLASLSLPSFAQTAAPTEPAAATQKAQIVGYLLGYNLTITLPKRGRRPDTTQEGEDARAELWTSLKAE